MASLPLPHNFFTVVMQVPLLGIIAVPASALFQMHKGGTEMRKRIVALLLFAVGLSLLTAGCPDTGIFQKKPAASYSKEDTFGPYRITVSSVAKAKDTTAPEEGKITVARTGMKTVSTVFETDPVYTSWVTDLDSNDKFEVLVWSVSPDEEKRGALHVYEWNEPELREQPFPDLTEAQKAGYRGHDDYSVDNNKVVRSFPVFSTEGGADAQSSHKRALWYSYHNGEWKLEQESE
jgi:hypothetical protein